MTDIDARLDIVGDLADPQAMPDPSGIRRGGDRRRWRARGITAAVALAVAAAVAVPAVDGATDRQSAPPAERDRGEPRVARNSGLDGWELARRIPVADEGIVVAARGSLWVVDRHDGEVDPASGRPLGVMHRIDHGSGRTTASVPGVVGGWPTVFDGAIWVASPPVDKVIRVDLDTLQRRVIRTSGSDSPGLRGLAVAAGAVWADNAAEGTLARIDPRTLRVTRTVDLGSDIDAVADPTQPVVWHGRIWTLLADSDEIVAVDPATGQVDRQPNPVRTFGGQLGVVNGRLAHMAGAEVTILSVSRSGQLTVDHEYELPLASETDTWPAEAYGSEWLLSWEGGELVQLDPDTHAVLGRIDIPTTGPQNDVGPTMTAAYGSLWIRVHNRLLEVRPQ